MSVQPKDRTADPSFEDIRATLKPVDAWWTVLVIDPIAVRLLWLLTRTVRKMTPGQITALSFTAGMIGAVMFGRGELIVGGLLYELFFLLDCIDGKLSRIRGLSSYLGSFLDGFVGEVVYAFCIFGMMVHLDSELALLSGAALLLAKALSNYLNKFYERSEAGVHAAVGVPGQDSFLRRHRLLAPLAFPDRHALLFLIGPIIGFTVEMMAVVAAMEIAIVVLKLQKTVRDVHKRSVEGATPFGW